MNWDVHVNVTRINNCLTSLLQIQQSFDGAVKTCVVDKFRLVSYLSRSVNYFLTDAFQSIIDGYNVHITSTRCIKSCVYEFRNL